MSAPARKRVSIISSVEEAGPSVASCFVLLRHRWATLGVAATDVCRDSRSSGFTGVKIGSMVVDASAVGLALLDGRVVEEVVNELTEPTPRADTATSRKQTGNIFMDAV